MGQIRYDYRVVETLPPFSGGGIRIDGPGGAASWAGQLIQGPTQWQNRVVPLSEPNWNVTAGTWAGLLANVTQVTILMPSSATFEMTAVDNVRLESVGLPGSNVDFVLTTGLDGLPCDSVFEKPAAVGDFVSVCLESPGGTLWGQPQLLATELIPSGSNPVGGLLPMLWLGPGLVILVNGFASGPLGFGQVVVPGGTEYGFQLPPGLVGVDVVFQGAAACPLPACPIGLAFSEAHIMRL